MADINKVIRIDNTLTNLIDEVTNESVNYNLVTTYYDGTPMDSSKVDGRLYREVNNEFFIKIFNDWGQSFLQKDTMQELKSLSSYELLLLKSGRYKGVKLNGYYSKGDTGIELIFQLSNTTEIDNDGTIISIGTQKLESKFNGIINVLSFGCKTDGVFDNGDVIQKAINYIAPKGGKINFSKWKDFYN